LVVPHTFISERMVAVIVVLVDRQNNRGSINDWHAGVQGVLNQPIIPGNAANY
jgi:hypothetical protein